jgi:hypothetical protein
VYVKHPRKVSQTTASFLLLITHMHACVHAHIQTKLGIRSLRPQCEPSVGNQSECAPRLVFPGLFVPPSLLPPLSLVLSLARAFARSRACSLSISLSLMRGTLSLTLSPFCSFRKISQILSVFPILLCMCPDIAMYVSSYCCICVLTLLCVCLYTAIHTCLHTVMCPHTSYC